VRTPRGRAGVVFAITAAGILGAFLACSEFTPPGATTNNGTLSISPKTAHLNVGHSMQLNAAGSSGALTWSSSNEQVATVTRGKVTGVGSGTVTIRAVSGTNQATARITVTRVAAIALSTASVSFSGIASAALPDSQAVDVTNAGEDPLTKLVIDSISYGPGASDWLAARLTETDAPAKLILRPTTAAFSAGVYSATVFVSSQTLESGSQGVGVSFTLGKQAVIVLTGGASFTAQQNTSLPNQQSIAITNGGDAPLTGLGVGTITYSSGASGWLDASLSSTAAPGSLRLAPNSTALAPGDYSATVNVTSSTPGVAAASTVVAYHITAAPIPPVIVVNPTTLNFVIGRNFTPLPNSQVSISSTGTGVVSGLSTSITYSGATTGWLSASLVGTTAPTTLNVAPTISALTPGVYSATIHVASSVTGVATKDIPVTYIVNDFVLGQTAVQFSTTSTALPSAQVIDVSNAGSGSISGVTATVTLLTGRAASSWNWLQASIANSVPQSPATSLALSILRADSLGDFTASVTISAPNMLSKTLNVSYRRQATLANDVMPILQMPVCLGCHSAPTSGNFNVGFANTDQAYTSLLSTSPGPYVTAGDSTNSSLFRILNGNAPSGLFNMPPSCSNNGSSCINSQLRTRIYIWIVQGALKTP
jgi:hypothetical protein